MRRVLFVTHIPDMSRPSGYRARTLAEMEAVRERNVHPYLLAVSRLTTFTSATARREFGCELRRRGLDGRIIPYPPAFSSGVGKRLSSAFSASAIAAAIRVFRPSIVHAENYQAAAASIAAARISPVQVIFDAHSAAPEEVALNGETRGHSESRIARDVGIARQWEQRAWSEAAAVITVSRALGDHFATTYGQRPSGAERVPCATTSGSFPAPDERLRVRTSLRIDDRDVVTYVGSMAPYQQAPEMVRLFASLYARRPRSFLLIVTQSPRDGWENLLKATGLPSSAYRIISAKTEDVPAVTAAGDVGLMLRRDIVVNHVAFPTKLAEYLAAGVPVLTTPGVRDPAAFVQEHGVGRVAMSFEAADVTELEALLGDVTKSRVAWSDRCRAAAAHHLLWENYAGSLCALYDSVADQVDNTANKPSAAPL